MGIVKLFFLLVLAAAVFGSGNFIPRLLTIMIVASIAMYIGKAVFWLLKQ